jgi:hypothetical protein
MSRGSGGAKRRFVLVSAFDPFLPVARPDRIGACLRSSRSQPPRLRHNLPTLQLRHTYATVAVRPHAFWFTPLPQVAAESFDPKPTIPRGHEIAEVGSPELSAMKRKAPFARD